MLSHIQSNSPKIDYIKRFIQISWFSPLYIAVFPKWGHATMQPITEADYLIAYPINTYINLAPRLANTWHKSYATLPSHMPLTNCSLDLSSCEPSTNAMVSISVWHTDFQVKFHNNLKMYSVFQTMISFTGDFKII